MARKKDSSKVTEHDINNSFKLCIIGKNPEQKEMLKVISKHDISFVKGAPGTGKTFLSVAYALQQLLKDKFERIIFTRPVVEAGGEKLGFLPGDIHDKIDPYMIPIFDAMAQLLPNEIHKRMLIDRTNGNASQIQVLPLAYMRGVTFRNAFVICDEMQNSTPEQIRMLLTRLGEGSKIIIAGDVKQSDIHSRNGLEDAFHLLEGVEGVGFVKLTRKAIVRHPIIEKIEERYEKRGAERRAQESELEGRSLYN
jgi:phosphate starvation-inducible PhoH-like protein